MPRIPFLRPEEIQKRIDQEAASDKSRKMTPEQIQAIYSSGTNILVSASAGSGKTFVMVQRILDMIARGVGVDELFISTFTVKAAGELKERLEAGLTDLLRTRTDPDQQAFIAQQLTLLDTADIGTMDAFTQKLVNQYGYLLGISPIFRIMTDNSEQDLLKNEVYADLFDDYMKKDDSGDFKHLVRNFAGSRKDSRGFRSLVYQIYAFSQATASPEKWLQVHFLKGYETYASLESLPSGFLQELLDTVLAAASQLRDLTESESYAKTKKDGKPTATYTKHLAVIEGLEEAVQQFQTDRQLAALVDKITERIPSGDGVTVAKVKYPIYKSLHGLLPTYRHLDTMLHYQEQALDLLHLLQRFALDFSDQYLQAKIGENAFEFNDIAHFAIRILEENPDIAQLYQDKYHEVMVDEYQDNSHTQERMLELLSNGHNRFMVGDIKQSIYRFRQADPQIFNQKFQLFQSDPTAGTLILLKENFRSSSEVLDATNGVFSHLMDEAVGDIRYDDSHLLVAGSPAQKEAHPQQMAQVLIYDKDSAASEGEEALVSQGEIDLVAKEIIRLHNEEEVDFKDITLLVPSRTRNDAIVRAFEGYGIPLVTDGGTSHYLQSVEVMVMLDTLRTIHNPLNDYALVALMRSPMFSFDEDQLARIAVQDDKVPFFDKLRAAVSGTGQHPELVTPALTDQLQLFLDTLSSWRTFAKTQSLYDLIWRIYGDRFYYDYVGTLERADQRQANLYALALRANQYEQTGFKGLSRFITMIDKVIASDNDLADVEMPAPKNAVQLMTIHKSKGLEFPYVFILNLDKKFFNAQQSEIYQDSILSREQGIGIRYLADMKDRVPESPLPQVLVKMETLPYLFNQKAAKAADLSERMRLLYVAMTRAEKRLYLVGKGSQAKLASQPIISETKNGFLLEKDRLAMTSFQDWLVALDTAFTAAELTYTLTYVTDEDLTPDKIGTIKDKAIIPADDLTNNRQSDQIRKALDTLESVAILNQRYQKAIELPSVRTPSQVKHFYQPVMDVDGVDIMEKEVIAVADTTPTFELPDFGKQVAVSGTAIGSATHELMQRLTIREQMSLVDIETALAAVQTDQSIKKKIDPNKILSFFETELGQLIRNHVDQLHREAPFAMLTKDPDSQEDFVVRGIIDGYLLLEDRIVLFDYKTDHFTDSQVIKVRYQAQMALYAQALRQSYGIKQVDKYLILLGGEDLEVVSL